MSEFRKIKAYVKRPDSDWYSTWLSDSLENLQRFVGGYIETVTLAEDVVIVCNEEGKLRRLPYNCTIAGEPFVGTIFACGVDGEEFADMPISLKEWKEVIG